MRHGWMLFLVFATLPLAGIGCANQKQQDDLARLTSEREQLREDISRERTRGQTLQAALAQGNGSGPLTTPDTYSDGGSRSDDQFGAGTTVSHRSGDLVVEVAGDVLFDPGSVKIKSSAKKTLDRIARAIMNKYAENHVRVEGYTDSDPIKKTKDKYDSNEELSAKRALEVEKYLVSKGVSSDRIYAAAFGPTSPRSTKKASRRVEIVILGAK